MNAARLPLFGAFIAFAVLAQSAFAADPVSVSIMALDETVGTMEVTVSAVGADGRPLPDMTAENFRVSVDDEQVRVRELRTPDAARMPAYVVLVVDVSGSMNGAPIEQARTAIRDFVLALEPADQVSIVSFAAEVAVLQEFTADRDLLGQAIEKLQPAGDTALFDGVTAGVAQIEKVPEGRRLVVLLSDGVATVRPEGRDASIEAARVSDVGIVAVGLGEEIDVQYLTDLTRTSNGRFLEAPTPESLQLAYTDLAFAIRSQYTLVIEVPATIDRRGEGVLRVHATYNADNSYSERQLAPLEGALAPPFDMNLAGLAPGDSLAAPIALQATPFENRELVSVEYLVDGEVVHSATGENLGYEFDPSAFAPGAYVLTVRAIDSTGNPGQIDVPFTVSPPVAAAEPMSIPFVPIAAALAALIVVFLLVKLINARRKATPTYVPDRVKQWSDRGGKLASAAEVPPDDRAGRRRTVEDAAAAVRESHRRRIGRIVVMNEGAIRGGELGSIQEVDMFNSPLTFGTGASADVRVEDQTGAIAAEEARLWVQRGRLVYHKLTTLSAMATEGITEGWQFLDSGEELRIGAYRLLFQTVEDEEQSMEEERSEVVHGLPQEHGMELRRAWENLAGGASRKETTPGSLDSLPLTEPFNREDSSYDSTSFDGTGDSRSA